jgi:hypothetical protein
MGQVWVQGALAHGGPREGDYPPLVRADAITQLRANRAHVIASTLDSEWQMTLADKRDSDGNKELPADFHLGLLAALTVARKKAADSEEDLVVTAEYTAVDTPDGKEKWQWLRFPLSALWSD